MPRYKVTNADGSVTRVTSFLPLNPEEVAQRATAQEMKGVLTNPLRKKANDFNKEEFAALPTWRKISKSTAEGFRESLKGGARSVGAMNEEDPVERADRIQREKQMADVTPGGRAAQIYGNVGATAPTMALSPSGAPLVNMVMQGVAGGLMSPGDPSERLQSAAIGGGLGAALRGAEKAVPAVAKHVGSALGITPATRSVVKGRVGKELADMSAADRHALVTALENAPPGQRALPATGSPEIASLEAANRQHPATRAAWSRTDLGENKATLDALSDLTGAKSGLNQNVEVAAQARNAAALPIQEQAIKEGSAALAPKRGPYTTSQRDLGQEILKKIGSPRSTDMAADKVLQRQLAELGTNPSFEQLANIRTTLSRSGAASEKPVYETMKAIDEAMTQVSPKWKDYLEKYTLESAPVNEAEAAKAVGRNFFDPVSGVASPNRVSGEALRNALSSGGEGASPSLRSGIENLAESQDRADLWKRVGAAEPTGADETMAQAGAQMAAGAAGAPGMVQRLLGLVSGGDKQAKMLSEALKNPQLMAKLATPEANPIASQMTRDASSNAVIQALRSLAGG